MISIEVIPFGDNYSYLCTQSDNRVFLIDPSHTGLLDNLSAKNLRLTHILLTHHHFDHTAGLEKFKKITGCDVVSADADRISCTDTCVGGGEGLIINGTEITVIATPGHTKTSVCYYLPARSQNPPMVFTGDTLFIAGCGYVIECDTDTMWNSLKKLLALPDETLVYCGHEYTEDNLNFALSIDPDNHILHKRLQEVKKLRTKGMPTVPSSIKLEKQINVFLRAADNRIKKALGLPTDWPASKVFAELRRRKDAWG